MKTKVVTLSYRGYVARFSNAPLLNKGFYFSQALIYPPGEEERGEIVSGRGTSPKDAHKDCIGRVKAKIDGWLK